MSCVVSSSMSVHAASWLRASACDATPLVACVMSCAQTSKGFNPAGVLAFEPAPVQVNFKGFPWSTGARFPFAACLLAFSLPSFSLSRFRAFTPHPQGAPGIRGFPPCQTRDCTPFAGACWRIPAVGASLTVLAPHTHIHQFQTHTSFTTFAVGDRVATPPENAQHYTERLLLLPSFYHVNGHWHRFESPPPPRAAREVMFEEGDQVVRFPDEHLVMCSFNRQVCVRAPCVCMCVHVSLRAPRHHLLPLSRDQCVVASWLHPPFTAAFTVAHGPDLATHSTIATHTVITKGFSLVQSPACAR